jgi:hypothetical protein
VSATLSHTGEATHARIVDTTSRSRPLLDELDGWERFRAAIR